MENLLERLAARLDLPAEVVAGTLRFTLTGTGRALVENHRGLLSYTESEVTVSGGSFSLRIRGDGLLLRAMNSEMLLVTGEIVGVDLL